MYEKYREKIRRTVAYRQTANHGKTKSERFQKRKAIFHSKNEM